MHFHAMRNVLPTYSAHGWVYNDGRWPTRDRCSIIPVECVCSVYTYNLSLWNRNNTTTLRGSAVYVRMKRSVSENIHSVYIIYTAKLGVSRTRVLHNGSLLVEKKNKKNDFFRLFRPSTLVADRDEIHSAAYTGCCWWEGTLWVFVEISYECRGTLSLTL